MEIRLSHLTFDKKRDSDNWQRRKPAKRGSEGRRGQRDSKKDGTHHDGREGITPRKSPFLVLAEMAMKPKVRYDKEEDRNNDRKTQKSWWERILEQEGMGSNVGYEQDNSIIRLGHGIKSEEEEQLEDDGGHSQYCPIKLGRGDLDQPNDRPVEDNL